MDRFQAMQVFTRVVDANSFTRAADHLGLPRTTVTTIIQNLEKLLNVRLLNRTTRRLSLTPDGAAYYERCIRILADVDEAEAAFQDASRRPRGKLRIDTPAAIGRLILIPSLCEFHDKYPDIELYIGMGDRPVDLVQEAVDCVIRVGELQDSSLVARRIGMFEGISCASPAYIERHGAPTTLEELAEHKSVNYFSSLTGRSFDWDFMVEGQKVEVKMEGVVSVNDADAYMACGLQGFGLIQPPRYMALPYLQSGELVEILHDWKPKSMPISVVYPHNRHLSPKVRAFTDWAAEIFSRCPLLSGRGDAVDSTCTWAGEHTQRPGMAKVPGKPGMKVPAPVPAEGEAVSLAAHMGDAGDRLATARI